MIDYKLHKNGWTVMIENLDLRKAQQQDIDDICKLIAKYTCVVIRNQSLEIDDELRVLDMFKDPFAFNSEVLSHPDKEGYRDCIVPHSKDYLIRVTAALDENGNPGFAGMEEELQWHCNDATHADRSQITWLYSVEGSHGSRTSWNNNVLSYRDLDEDTKQKIQNVKAKMCHWTDGEEGREYFTPNIVHTNLAGQTGLFFPFLQISHFVGMSKEESDEFKQPLVEHTTQEKYMYHHDWQDGDLIVSEQSLGIHKRWPFPDMKNRLLHRAVMDFNDLDYTDI
jgi:taurine dioxygenase|tara:strand:- start:2091 stop:2933 length:843 start_codon:yes stop_codon:yes gene_type:complete